MDDDTKRRWEPGDSVAGTERQERRPVTDHQVLMVLAFIATAALVVIAVLLYTRS